MYQYSVRYRRSGQSGRVYRMTVTARDADEARAKVAIHDPLFGSTVESPKRRAVVAVFDEPEQPTPDEKADMYASTWGPR